MNQIQSLIARVDQRDDLGEIRLEIIALITHHLKQNEAFLDYWETAHFTNALGSLSMNVNSPHQPTYGGLRLCLFDIEKALNAHIVERTDYDAIRQMAKPITYDMLMETLSTIRARIDRMSYA